DLGRVLVDVGCGMGTFTVEAAHRGARALGIDFAPEALPAAAAVARAEGAERAWFTRADAVHMPLRDDSADVVVAADITEHLDDATLRGVLSDVRRVLRSGGTFVVYTPESSQIGRASCRERVEVSGGAEAAAGRDVGRG